MTGYPRWTNQGPMHRPYSSNFNMHHRTRPGLGPRPNLGVSGGGSTSNQQPRLGANPQTQHMGAPPQQRLNQQSNVRPGNNQLQQKYQITPGARNQPDISGDVVGLNTEPLSQLAQTDPLKRKQIIGEHLYRAIVATHPDKAGKITGMLLEMDNSELLHMLEAPESLNSKVEEAVNVLQEHQQREQI